MTENDTKKQSSKLKIRKTMAEGNIWSRIFVFAVPIMLSNMFNQVYTAVDSIVVGKVIGHEALAAVGANMSIINVLLCLFLGVGVGGGVIVSQYYGARDVENVQKSVHTVMLVAFVFGAVLTVIGYFFARPILMLIKTPADVLDLSVDYLEIYFLGILTLMVYNIGAGVLRAVGSSLMPFLYLAIGSVINIGLDIWFVAGLGWGVKGAAWATVISHTFSSICVLCQLIFTKGAHKLSLSKLRFDGPILKKVLRIGLPIGLQTSMYSFANLLIQANLNIFGSEVMAGWSAAQRIDAIAYTPVSALGSAINTFAGQNFGARELGRVKKGTYSALIMAVSAAIIMMIPMLAYRQDIVRQFNDNPQVIEYGSTIMTLVLPTYIVFAVSEVLSGTLKGIGRSSISAILSFSGILVVRIIWLYAVLPFFQEPFVLFFVHPVSWVCCALLFVMYYLIKGWNNILKVQGPAKLSEHTVNDGVSDAEVESAIKNTKEIK